MKRSRRKGMKVARAVFEFGAALAALLALSAIIAKHEETHGAGSFDALE